MERIEPIANVLNHCINYHIKVAPIPSTIKTKPWYLRTNPFSSSFGSWIYNLVRTNDTFVIAKSISFSSMDQQEFEQLFDKLLNVISKELQTKPEAIRLQIEDFY